MKYPISEHLMDARPTVKQEFSKESFTMEEMLDAADALAEGTATKRQQLICFVMLSSGADEVKSLKMKMDLLIQKSGTIVLDLGNAHEAELAKKITAITGDAGEIHQNGEPPSEEHLKVCKSCRDTIDRLHEAIARKKVPGETVH